MKKTLLALVALGAAVAPAWARQLTPAEALEAAIGSRATAAMHAPSAQRLVYTAQEADLNTLYVFAGENGGFTVVAADDVCTPLLGYSTDAAFDPAAMPVNLQSWLAEYSSQIARAAATGGSVLTAPADPSLTDVAPITKTRWNQDAPYNDLSPRVNGQQTYTGCVATAVAQVMKTYEWPVHGSGTGSYTWNNQILTFDYENTTFEWDQMLDYYRNVNATAAQKNAVATLMYGIGVSCQMSFGTGGSGAHGINAAIGLAQYLDYDASLRYLSRDYYPLPQWCRMLHAELAQGHPLYYDGANSTVGHAFVIDGYRASDGLFHVNWGWGGMSDGYFAITTLDPDNQGIGGSTAGYAQGQSAIFGLKPQAGGEVVPVMNCTGAFAPYAGTYKREDGVITILGGGIYSYSIGTINISFGVSLTDAEGNESHIWCYGDEVVSLDPWYGLSAIELEASEFPTTGTYTVRPVIKDADTGEIYTVNTLVGTPAAATAECTDANVVFTPVEQVAKLGYADPELLSPFFRSKLAVVQATLTNTGDEYYGIVRAKIKGNTKLEAFGEVLVDLLPGASETVTFSGILPFALKAGETTIGFYDEKNRQIGDLIPVTVAAAPTGTPAIEFGTPTCPFASAGAGTLESPYVVDPSEIIVHLPLNGTSGYWTDQVYMLVYQYPQTYLGYIEGPVRPVAAGGTTTVPFTASEDLDENAVYIAVPATLNGNSLVPSENIRMYFRAGQNSGVNAPESSAGGIYPNPATEAATISAPEGIETYMIANMAGAVVMEGTGNGASEVGVDVGRLAAGVYVVRLTLANGTTATLRLIKR